MKKPLVSVIITTIGRPKIIGRAIDSILNQTFTDIELIIGDVSQNDETERLVSQYLDERIKYYHIIDETDPALTMNSIISSALGDLIAFCDDDDEWSSPYKLSKQIKQLNDMGDEYSIVYCWYDVWDDRENRLIETRTPAVNGNIFNRMLGDNVMAGTPNLLIRKNLFDKHGGWVEGLIYSADHLMLTKLSQFTKVTYVPEILVRVHHYHVYGRQTNLGTSNLGYRNRIAYQEYFLQKFKDDFKIYKKQQTPHLRVIINDYLSLCEPSHAARYLLKYLSITLIDNFSIKSGAKLFIQIIGLSPLITKKQVS